jgi:hypothetical protein
MLVNERIDARTRARLDRLVDEEDAEGTQQRLEELAREWDIDRAVMAVFATVGGLALLLGYTRARRWHALLGAQLGFLLYHAVVGWCPPVAVLRRLGFRTNHEICAERVALVDRLR